MICNLGGNYARHFLALVLRDMLLMILLASRIFISRVCPNLNWTILPQGAQKSVRSSKARVIVPNRKESIAHRFTCGLPQSCCVMAKHPCDWRTGTALRCYCENFWKLGFWGNQVLANVKLRLKLSAIEWWIPVV